jgi:transcriptional regulator with XRE-family HTH domain
MIQKVARPGAALKAFRERNGWTLAEVGRRTGMTISTLSKVENDRVSLNFEKLTRLSSGLGLDMASLLSGQPLPTAETVSACRRSTTRKGEETVTETASYNHLYLATDLLNKRFNPTIVEPRARSIEEFGELIRHPGEEFAFVLEGSTELHSCTYAPLILNAGDSVYFDSGMGHAFLAVGSQPCRLLLVSSAPEPAAAPAEEAPPEPDRVVRRLVRRA